MKTSTSLVVLPFVLEHEPYIGRSPNTGILNVGSLILCNAAYHDRPAILDKHRS
jgi:hypothetical protein